jgi:hypothetical protein
MSSSTSTVSAADVKELCHQLPAQCQKEIDYQIKDGHVNFAFKEGLFGVFFLAWGCAFVLTGILLLSAPEPDLAIRTGGINLAVLGIMVFYRQYRKHFNSPFAIQINLNKKTITLFNKEYSLEEVQKIQLVHSILEQDFIDQVHIPQFYGLRFETAGENWELAFRTYTPKMEFWTEFGHFFTDFMSHLTEHPIEFCADAEGFVFNSQVEYRVSKNYIIQG